MKVEYNNAGLSHCIEFGGKERVTCITIEEAKQLRDGLTKAIEEAESGRDLTPFEREYIRLYEEGYADGQAGSKMLSETVLKDSAKELLEIARKDTLIASQTEYEKSRADVLRDMPRWKKARDIPEIQNQIFDTMVPFLAIGPGNTEEPLYYLLWGGHAISLRDLEKLPKEI